MAGQTVSVPGTLAKAGGAFDIEHPLKKQKWRLVHSFVEGTRCDNIYRGKKQLTNGKVIVNIDLECVQEPECSMTEGTFEVLCANPTVYLQNSDNFDRVIGNIIGNKLYITCENETSNSIINWLVIAERKDPAVLKWNRTNAKGYLITEYIE